MLRDFKKGTNQLPTASINPEGKLYPLKAKLKSGESESVLNAVYEIDERDAEKSLYTVVQPTEDNIPYSRLVFGAAKVSANDFFEVGFADKSQLRWVAFDDEDGEPEIGDYIGVKKETYKMSMYKFGFVCLAYDSDNELVLVRPEPFMPILVRATEAESSNKVNVKFADYEGTTYKEAFEVNTVSES